MRDGCRTKVKLRGMVQGRILLSHQRLELYHKDQVNKEEGEIEEGKEERKER